MAPRDDSQVADPLSHEGELAAWDAEFERQTGKRVIDGRAVRPYGVSDADLAGLMKQVYRRASVFANGLYIERTKPVTRSEFFDR